LMSLFSPERGLRLGEPKGEVAVADAARGLVGCEARACSSSFLACMGAIQR
jgi:hypothetical protein